MNNTDNIRYTVLDYALSIEDSVNTLLQLNLGINNKENTKNFGNKAGIPFKSKIDLLYDINVLSKEEHFNLELLMVLRNKFCHDINMSTFNDVLAQLDNGLVNKFKKFFNDSDVGEEGYRNACYNLFMQSLKMLLGKYGERSEKIERLSDVWDFLLDNCGSQMSMSFKFSQEILKIFENSDLTNPAVLKLSEIVQVACKEHSDNIMSNYEIFKSKSENFPYDIIVRPGGR